jgi:hypothetical protein
MLKKVIQGIALFLVLFVYASSPTFAVDTENAAGTRASLYLDSYNAYVHAAGGGNLEIWFDVIATGHMDEVGALTIIIQSSKNGSTWSTMQTFLHSDYASMLEYDDFEHCSYVEYKGISGQYYRAYVTIWAGRNGDGDSRQILTRTVRAL